MKGQPTCTKCGSSDVRKDGVRDFGFGTRQRYQCNSCQKRFLGTTWITYDKDARAAFDQQRYEQYLKDKAEYNKAKEATGFGGFRLNDL